MFLQELLPNLEFFVTKHKRVAFSLTCLAAIAVLLFTFMQALTARAEPDDLIEIQNDHYFEAIDFVHGEGGYEPSSAEFTLVIRNNEDISEAGVLVEVVDFESQGQEGEIRVLRDNPRGAAQWLIAGTPALGSGSVSLDETDGGKANSIDFSVEPPAADDRPEDGSYSAALLVKDASGQVLGRRIIIVNLRSSSGDSAEIEAALSGAEVNLETGAVEIVLANQSVWYITQVELRVGPPAGDSQLFDLEQEAELGILPEVSQRFVLADPQSLIDFVDSRSTEDWEVAVELGNGRQVALLEVADDSVIHVIGQSGGDDAGQETSGDQENNDPTQSAASDADDQSGIAGFVSDNPMLAAIGIGLIGLVFALIFVIARRRARKISRSQREAAGASAPPPLPPEPGSVAADSLPPPAAAQALPNSLPASSEDVPPPVSGPPATPPPPPAAAQPPVSGPPASMPQDKLASLPKIEAEPPDETPPAA